MLIDQQYFLTFEERNQLFVFLCALLLSSCCYTMFICFAMFRFMYVVPFSPLLCLVIISFWAACCHMALVFAVMHLYIYFCIASLLSFFILVFKNMELINRRNGPRYQRALALWAFFSGAIPKGLILCKLCIWYLYVHVLFYIDLRELISGLSTCVQSNYMIQIEVYF